MQMVILNQPVPEETCLHVYPGVGSDRHDQACRKTLTLFIVQSRAQGVNIYAGDMRRKLMAPCVRLGVLSNDYERISSNASIQ